MKRYKWIILGFALTIFCSYYSHAQAGSGTQIDRAQELINLARQAVGGEVRLQEVKGLALTGKINRPGQEQEEKLKLVFFMMDGKDMPATFDAEVDHMIKVEPGQGQGVIINKEQTNGESVIIFKRQKSGEAGEAANLPDKQEQHIVRLNVQGNGNPDEINLVHVGPPEIDQMLLAVTLKTMPGAKLNYLGDNSNGSADVVEVTSHHGQTTKLALDKATHLPVSVSFRSSEPMMIKVTGPANQAEIEKQLAAMPKPQQSNVELRFSDHRLVDGLLVPHHITKVVDGEVKEEWQIEKYQINPNPETIHPPHKKE